MGLHQDESDADSDSSPHRDDGDPVDIDMLSSPREEQFSRDDVAKAPGVGKDDCAPSEDEDEDEDDGSQVDVVAQAAKTGKNPMRTPPIPVFSQSNSAERTFVPLRSMTRIDVDMLVRESVNASSNPV
jgi:hypothetical protein